MSFAGLGFCLSLTATAAAAAGRSFCLAMTVIAMKAGEIATGESSE